MKRSRWKQYAAQLACELEAKPYEHWVAAAKGLPDSFTRDFNGEVLQIELDVLEIDPDYVHIGISIDDGGLSAFVPVTTSALIRRN